MAATAYGKNLGLAFQLVDDLLDFGLDASPKSSLFPDTSSVRLGKPIGADLTLGLATGPVLFAAQQFPELWPMIERKFSFPGDANKVR